MTPTRCEFTLEPTLGNSTSTRVCWYAGAGIALAFVILTGVFPYGRGGGAERQDAVIFHAVGQALVHGDNPYDTESLEHYLQRVRSGEFIINDVGNFAYPPWVLPAFAPFGLMDFADMVTALILLNLAILLGSAWLLTCMTPKASCSRSRTRLFAFGAPLVAIATPAASHQLWLGQVSLAFYLLIIVAMAATAAGKKSVAGVCLGLAGGKPQVVAGPVAWLIHRRHWRPIGASVLCVLVLVLISFLLVGTGCLTSWPDAIRFYEQQGGNWLGHPDHAGLASIAVFLGLPIPSMIIVILITFGAAYLTLVCFRNLGVLDAVAILFLIQAVVGRTRNVEFFVVAPALVVLAGHARTRPWLWGVVILGFLFPYLPKSLLPSDALGLKVAKTVYLAGLLGFVMLAAVRRRSKTHSPSDRNLADAEAPAL